MSSLDSTWSPADNPHAIAVSEAQWWFRSAMLTGLRIHGEDDCRVGFSSRQIDARQLVVALWQLRLAEKLQQHALRELGVDLTVIAALSRARTSFDKVMPGLRHMRDGMLHFDEWTRGTGAGPQRKAVVAGTAPREVAAEYSRFGYDPATDEVTFGPYTFEVTAALDAARGLADAIYTAACAVDLRNAAALRTRTAEVLRSAELGGAAGRATRVVLAADTRVWVSLENSAEPDRGLVAERVVEALTAANLRLVSSREPQSEDWAERLENGEALFVE
ncbi:hypothetical protein [Amycolatopsis solani]|uniref:hypothetical protein n=1 Tax=Amycolatopsis solani TaxID=3028615 RepID=UPI0025B23BA7|nr:hypothetical protein [Amycolatopsis sp. MEP2-6]